MPTVTENQANTNGIDIGFDIRDGTLYIGNQFVTGIAARDMVDAAVYTVENTLADRLQILEQEIDAIKHLFTAELVREIVERCEQFVSDREISGMSDEEFEQSIQELLFERVGA